MSAPVAYKCAACGKTKAAREFPRNAGGGRRGSPHDLGIVWGPRRRTCRTCGPKPVPVAGWRATEFATNAARRKAVALAELGRRGITLTPAAPAEETHEQRTATE